MELTILPQPDDNSCGPTSLHAVYRYYDLEVELTRLIADIRSLETDVGVPLFDRLPGGYALTTSGNALAARLALCALAGALLGRRPGRSPGRPGVPVAEPAPGRTSAPSRPCSSQPARSRLNTSR